MAQTAGFKGKIKHATSLIGSYTAIDGIKSISVTRNRAEIDISDLADDDGWRRFIAGMGDISVSLDGSLISGDTQQDALMGACANGTTVFLQVLPNGTHGFKGEFLITSFNPSAGMDNEATVSVTARLTGAPTSVTP